MYFLKCSYDHLLNVLITRHLVVFEWQNEWDELMLETFSLKQHLDTTRQELSQALYQHDAACRVIARLMRERDEARSMLSSLAAQGVDTSSSSSQQGGGGGDMEVEEQQEQKEQKEEEAAATSGSLLSAGVLAVLGDTCASLSKGRKGRKPPASQATKEDLIRGCDASSSSQTLSVTPHATAKPGVTCLAMTHVEPEEQESSYLALTGGADKMAFLTDLRDGKVVAKLAGHSKKITAVALHSSSNVTTAFTASADHSIKVWTPDSSEGYAAAVTFSNAHSGEISSLCAHPSGSYVLGVSADDSWSFLDVSRGMTLLQARNGHEGEKFSCGDLHPDGLILACGASSGAVRLWDIREQKNVASLGEEQGHSKGVSCLTFNQNGYLLASGGGEGSCKV